MFCVYEVLRQTRISVQDANRSGKRDHFNHLQGCYS